MRSRPLQHCQPMPVPAPTPLPAGELRILVGGFHSPMELECLRILLRGRQPIVLCPARHIDGMLIPKEWRQAFQDQRLLVVSPFGENAKRITRDHANSRNRLVAALADSIIVPHAAPESHTLKLSAELLLAGKPIRTFGDRANADLIGLGALQIDNMSLYSERIVPSKKPLPAF